MRVVLITGDYPPAFAGGVASWTHDLGRAFHDASHAVTVLARAHGDTAAEDAGSDFPVQRLWNRSWNRWQGEWAWLGAAREVRRGDLVVASTWGVATRSLALVRSRGARLAVAFHGSDLTRLTTAPPELLAVVGAADLLLPVSDFLKAELVRLGLSHPRVVVPPWPLRAPTTPVARPEHGLLVVARLTALKGIDRAIALAVALGEPLMVVGDGAEGEALRAHAPKGVRFVGPLPRERMGEWYAKARATVLLSRPAPDGLGAEGLGLVLLESAAHGVPVIGCRTGGVPEAVGPGLLLDDPDAPDLAAVQTFLKDGLAGERARQWVLGRHHPAATVQAILGALS